MASHTSTREARLRASKKYYEKNREKRQLENRENYYNNPEVRERKINKIKQIFKTSPFFPIFHK